MVLLRWSLFQCAILLSSCGSTTQNAVESGFKTPDLNGAFDVSLVQVRSGVIDGTVSYITGFEEGVALHAYAGIIPDQPIQLNLSGNARFEGTYEAAVIRNILIEDDVIKSGINEKTDGGRITLFADLDTLTLIGSDGILSVEAQITDNNILTGDVEMFGIPGILQGEIGDDRAFGAFHGADDTNLMSGGFVTNRAP